MYAYLHAGLPSAPKGNYMPAKKKPPAPSKRDAPISFRLTPELIHEFKVYAVSHGYKYNGLFEAMFEAFRKSNR